MAAGLYCITTNYGALFETGAEFPMYIPYEKNYKLAQKFAYGIEAAAKSLHRTRNTQSFRMSICICTSILWLE